MKKQGINHVQANGTPPPLLRDAATAAITQLLDNLEGEPCSDLHTLVLSQVEEPLLNAIMAYTQGNQSKAAAMLGLNRGTLRSKLKKYGLLATPD